MMLRPLEELAREWTREAALFRKRGLDDFAQFAESLASDLLEALEDLENEPLTLAEAAEISGYSSDHLGRLVRDGTITNAGRPGAPRIFRRDLPLKAESRVSKPTENGHISNRQVVQSIIEGA